MLAATKIWNSSVWESREARKNNEKYPTESKLKEKFKNYESWKQLHSQSSQSTVEEYFEAVRSYAKHKKESRNEMRPPGFKPKTAEFQQKMSRCKEGSRKWKALLNAKLKALRKLERRINQQINALTKLLADLDQAENIAFSVLGNLTGIRQKSRTGDKNKKANQKINQLPYAQIKQQHKYKSLLKQVYPDNESEKFSSQTCGNCGARNKSYRVHRGLWRCKNCNAIIHADLNGADGILKNYLFGRCDMGQIFKPKSLEVYRWNKQTNRFTKVSPRAAA